MTNLFQFGLFTLHSGKTSPYKIECDALTDADIETLAWLITRRVKPFKAVVGVPKGGTRLAAALNKFACSHGALLIIDDVLTTGGSMENYRKHMADSPIGMEGVIGAVIFARTQPPDWITALFTMAPEVE